MRTALRLPIASLWLVAALIGNQSAAQERVIRRGPVAADEMFEIVRADRDDIDAAPFLLDDDPPDEGKPKYRLLRAAVDVWLFGSARDAAMAPRQIDDGLRQKIEQFDLRTGLSDAERRQLLLAGRGDIQRFFDRVETVRVEITDAVVDEDQLGTLLHDRVNPLRRELQALFGKGSLFEKSTRRLLNSAKAGRMAAVREIERYGGQIRIWKRRGEEVIEVRLSNSVCNDDVLPHLRELAALRYLALDGTRVTDVGLKHLQDLKQLEVLELGRTRVTGPGLAHLDGMPRLSTLDLGDAPVTDAGLAALRTLPSLSRLVLTGTNVTGSGLEDARGFDALVELHLGRSKFEGEFVARLKQFTRLQELDLTGVRISDTQMESLAAMTTLKRLILDDTGVTDAGLEKLALLKSLARLDLRRCAVTDAGLTRLYALKDLDVIDLTGTQVTERGVEELRRAVKGLIAVR